MGHGDTDFIHTKMGNRSDMGSSTPQDPRGSDDVSSNPVNDTNDECSDASQKLDQVLVDGILCSKSHSEEMVSDSVSDKCVSPSRTSHSALKMKNKVAVAPPVDKLNPTSVRNHPEDIPNDQALVQETACSDPCSAENLDNKCHSFTAMNFDSLEVDVSPILNSQKSDNTPPTKEAYVNDALETVTSGILSEENIIPKRSNQDVDVSISSLNHADESLLQLGSGSNNEFGCENGKDLLLNRIVASNETRLDENGLNASDDSSETVVV